MNIPKEVQAMADALIPNEVKNQKFHAVMLFFHQGMDFGIPKEMWEEKNPTGWVNTKTIDFDNASDALNYYANTRCPASQHLCADTKEELEQERNRMIQNFCSEKWLNENLYPYL